MLISPKIRDWTDWTSMNWILNPPLHPWSLTWNLKISPWRFGDSFGKPHSFLGSMLNAILNLWILCFLPRDFNVFFQVTTWTRLWNIWSHRFCRCIGGAWTSGTWWTWCERPGSGDSESAMGNGFSVPKNGKHMILLGIIKWMENGNLVMFTQGGMKTERSEWQYLKFYSFKHL